MLNLSSKVHPIVFNLVLHLRQFRNNKMSHSLKDFNTSEVREQLRRIIESIDSVVYERTVPRDYVNVSSGLSLHYVNFLEFTSILKERLSNIMASDDLFSTLLGVVTSFRLEEGHVTGLYCNSLTHSGDFISFFNFSYNGSAVIHTGSNNPNSHLALLSLFLKNEIVDESGKPVGHGLGQQVLQIDADLDVIYHDLLSFLTSKPERQVSGSSAQFNKVNSFTRGESPSKSISSTRVDKKPYSSPVRRADDGLSYISVKVDDNTLAKLGAIASTSDWSNILSKLLSLLANH